jgi:ArsR family transcriptional regulator
MGEKNKESKSKKLLHKIISLYIIILEYSNIARGRNMSAMYYELSASMLKALAHKTRIQILERLKSEEELCVCHIYEELELEQSNVSQHLKVLKDKGILTSRKDGLKVMYRVRYKEIYRILDLVKDILAKQLEEAHEQLGIKK